jgi:hypothetical protein
MPQPALLAQSPYFEVYHADTHQALVVRRTPKPFENLLIMEGAFHEVFATFRKFSRPSTRLVVDLRDGPSRNDPAFEEALRPLRQELLRNFQKIAFLVKSVVGGMQVQRHHREDPFPGQTFYAEDDAWQFLNSPSLPPRSVQIPPSYKLRFHRSFWLVICYLDRIRFQTSDSLFPNSYPSNALHATPLSSAACKLAFEISNVTYRIVSGITYQLNNRPPSILRKAPCKNTVLRKSFGAYETRTRRATKNCSYWV